MPSPQLEAMRARPGKQISIGPLGWAALAVLLAPAAQARGDAKGKWTVRSGEALSTIATRFGVSVHDLRSWNGLEGDRILPGQELIIEADPGDSSAPPGFTYEVQPGDTLSAIATRFDTSLEELIELNPELDPDRIRTGQELRLRGGHRTDHRIAPGETLSHIASYHRVSVDDIMDWNPGLDPDRIRAGATLRIYSERPLSVSESIGLPYRGRLKSGVRLPRHAGYVIRDRDVAWGTRETVDWIVDAFDQLREEYPRAARVRVHDLSDGDGGWLRGHRSHQSGRDADIAYFQKGRRGQTCLFRPLRAEHLDVERQWALLRHWLEHDRAEAVFIDYRLQKPLYEHARRLGATREQLHRWFQYPRGRSYPLGVIRHFPKHHDHLHVRFVCPETDTDCKETR